MINLIAIIMLSLLAVQGERDSVVYTPIKPKPIALFRDTIMVEISGKKYYYELKEDQKPDLLKPYEARYDGKTYILRRLKDENTKQNAKGE